MATSIPGVTGYVPQAQPWRPDLNFYSKALQRRQSQYDAAYNKVSSLYGSLLNAPMLRDSNIERRNAFFKAIDNDIKKISTMDLSLQQNVDSAMELFRPFYEDDNIINDMTYTKKLQTEMQRGESYKNCSDPQKCNGQYWEGGIRYLNYMAEEFKKATDEEALSMRAPEYAPFFNITDLATKVAKAKGFKITTVNTQGGYLVTETNGVQQVLPLASFLHSEFGNNPDIMKMYGVMSVLKRKDWIKDNAFKYENEDAAENAYIQDIISKHEKTAEKSLKSSQNDNEVIKNNIKAIENHVENNGALPGGSEAKDLEALYDQMQRSEKVVKQKEEAQNVYKSLPNSFGDMKALRSKADQITLSNLFDGDMQQAAVQYAMNTYQQKKDKDPYYFEQVQFRHKLSYLAQQQAYTRQNMRDKFEYDKQNIYYRGLVQAELQKLKKKNAIVNTHGTEDQNMFEALEETASGATGAVTDLHKEHGDLFAKSLDDLHANQANLLDNSVNYLMNQATLEDASGATAKAQLQKILGKNYDAKNNRLVNSKGQVVNKIEDAINMNSLGAMSGTALSTIKGSSLYKSFYNSKIRDIEGKVNDANLLNQARLQIMLDTNRKIKEFANVSTRIKSEDKNDFLSLFDKNNGIMSKAQWAKDYSRRTGEDLDDSEDRYDELWKQYDQIYKDGGMQKPGVPNLVTSAAMLPGSSVFMKGTTGKYSSGGKATFDGTANGTKPALALYSFTKNAEDAGHTKALFGDDLTKNDYSGSSDDKNAWLLFKAINDDLQKGGYKATDKLSEIPKGAIIYRGVAANDPNLVAVTLKPNAEYLRKFVSTPNKKSFLQEADYEKALEGITVFMDKDKATKNIFHEMSKHSKYDIMAAVGMPIGIKVPETANLSFTKKDDRVVTTGFLLEKYVDENGQIKTERLNAADLPSSNISFGDYIDRVKYMVDMLEQRNAKVQSEYDKNYLKYSVQDLFNQANPTQESMMQQNMNSYMQSINPRR